MDGGAMGAYDAYAMGVKLCISDDGYHKNIPDMEYSFGSKEEFVAQLDRIVNQQVDRINFYRENSVDNYVKRLVRVFSGESSSCIYDRDILDTCIKQKRRENYFPNTFGRKMTHIIIAIQKWVKFQLINR